MLLSKFDPEQLKAKNNSNSLREYISNKIGEDKMLLNYLSYGTNSKANLIYTFRVLGDLFNNNINS